MLIRACMLNRLNTVFQCTQLEKGIILTEIKNAFGGSEKFREILNDCILTIFIMKHELADEYPHRRNIYIMLSRYIN